MKILHLLPLLLLLQSCFFFKPSQEKQLKNIESIKPFDVIIIPGLPLYNGTWDTLLKSRILWSEYLYKNGYAKNIIYSGNAVYTKWYEGPSMALYANQLGISKNDILIDTIAEHSTENLFYGYQLAKLKGYKNIAVATDPFQCIMLKKYSRKHFHEPIYFLPIIYDSIRTRMQVELVIDTLLTQKKYFVPLEERQGYNERLKGTRGRHIEN